MLTFYGRSWQWHNWLHCAEYDTEYYVISPIANSEMAGFKSHSTIFPFGKLHVLWMTRHVQDLCVDLWLNKTHSPGTQHDHLCHNYDTEPGGDDSMLCCVL